MPSLKDLRLRIKSVKSTQKITSAMKMVAAAKLRKAQEKAEAARPYALSLEQLLVNALAQQPAVSNLVYNFSLLAVGMDLFFIFFVGTVQAFVFTMLTLTYIAVAIK